MTTTANTAASYIAVTKSDSVPVAGGSSSAALYVGTGGDVALKQSANAAAITFKNVPSGATLPIQVYQVMSTNTTASDFVALF